MEPLEPDPLAKAGKWKTVTTSSDAQPPASEHTLPSRNSEGAEGILTSREREGGELDASEPGEFTRLFQAPAGTIAAAHPPTTPDRTAEQPLKPALEPGEFTRFFGGPFQARPPASSPHIGEPDREATPEQPLPTTSEPGEFTRIFREPSESVPPETPAIEPWLPEPRPAVSHSPGGFTQIFGSTPSFPPGPKSEADRATQVFKTPVPVLGIPQQPSSQGPGEYTRIIRPSAHMEKQDQQPSAPKSVNPAASARTKPVSYLPLILTLNVLFLLAMGLVLYFALRR